MAKGGQVGTTPMGNNPMTMVNPVAGAYLPANLNSAIPSTVMNFMTPQGTGAGALNTSLPNVGNITPPGASGPMDLARAMAARATSGQASPGGGAQSAPAAAGQDAASAMMSAMQGTPAAPTGGAAAAAAAQAKIAQFLKMLG